MKQMLATREKSLYNKKRYINKEKLTLVDKYIEKSTIRKLYFGKGVTIMDLSTGVPVSIQLKRLSNKAMNKRFFFDLEGQLVKWVIHYTFVTKKNY